MATEQRRTEPDLAGVLQRQFPGQDDLFQLIRIAERLRRLGDGNGGVARVGNDGPPTREAVRFETANSPAFQASAVHRIQPGSAGGSQATLTVNLLGLTGPTGVLPQHYTTLIQQRLRNKDTALSDFLNIFNHRLISLYYRAWAKHRPVIAEEHNARGATSPFTATVRALAGQHAGTSGDASLYYSGHFSRRTRSVAAVRRMLEDFLRHPVTVEPFVGQWLEIPRAQRFQLGRPAAARGERLGGGLLVGHRVWDAQSRIRIHIGPVSSAEHEALLPSEPLYRALLSLLRAYLPPHLSVELRFTIREAENASARRALGNGMRLGWTAWARSKGAGIRHASHTLPASSFAGSNSSFNREA